MASTYSTNLALELMATGDQSGTWGVTNNTNLGTLIEQAVSGYVTQAITDGADTVITIPNGATGVARNMYIECTGALTAGRNLVVPANKKLYFVYNNTTGGFAVTVKVSGQTGIAVPSGKKISLVNNGTDIFVAENYMVGAFSAVATFNNGGAGAASGTTYDGSTARTISYNTVGAPSTTGTSASGTWAISISGTAATATTATAVANPLTMNNGGAGAASGTLFDGSVARTISYNTVGAPSTAGTNATGTWGIGISGNAATATTANAVANALTINNGGAGAASGATFTGGAAVTISYNTVGAVPLNGALGTPSSGTLTNCTFPTLNQNTSGYATTLQTVDDTTTNSTYYPTFSTSSSSTNNSLKTSSTKLTFNPSTGALAATVLNATSDRNAKTDITPIMDAVEIIQRIHGVRFSWKDTGLPSAGLIAQDVQAVLPELVTEEDHKLSLNYNGVIGVLVEAIKTLTQRVEDLESR